MWAKGGSKIADMSGKIVGKQQHSVSILCVDWKDDMTLGEQRGTTWTGWQVVTWPTQRDKQ